MPAEFRGWFHCIRSAFKSIYTESGLSQVSCIKEFQYPHISMGEVCIQHKAGLALRFQERYKIACDGGGQQSLSIQRHPIIFADVAEGGTALAHSALAKAITSCRYQTSTCQAIKRQLGRRVVCINHLLPVSIDAWHHLFVSVLVCGRCAALTRHACKLFTYKSLIRRCSVRLC
jgi:hypothetical protein